jgi:hypothetical protein
MPRELGVDIDDMYVALGRVPNDGLVVLASGGVGLDVDAEGAVELQLQAVMVVSIARYIPNARGDRVCSSHGSILTLSLLPLATLHALRLQIRGDARQPLALLLQPLALDFQVARLLRDLELLGIQFEDLGGVVGGVVLREGVAVVGAEGLMGA